MKETEIAEMLDRGIMGVNEIRKLFDLPPLEKGENESTKEGVKNLTCTQCGGQIDRTKMICPYCGTQYLSLNG